MADTHASYQAGRDGAVFTGSSYAEFQAFQAGRDSAAGAMNMPVGGALIMAQLYALAAACFWPVAGALTLGTFLGLRTHIMSTQPPYSPVVWVPMLLGATAAAFYLGYRIEDRLNLFTPYRRLRVLLRLVLIMLMLTSFALSWRRPPVRPAGGLTLDWVLRQLAPWQIGMIVVGAAVMHKLSRRSDEKFEVWAIAAHVARQRGGVNAQEMSALIEDVQQQRVEERLDVRRLRIRSGVHVGVVAALLLMVTGAPAGGVLVGGVVFGGIGALLSPFVPQNLIGMRWLHRWF
jgi:hypothetical protein